MDNLTHSLLGAALSKSRLGSLHPRAASLLVVAANLPDLDIVAAAWGKEAYLVHHRGITHGVLGALLQALALAVVVRVLDARAGGARPSWGAVLALCGVGCASHPALDFLNTYGLRPWLPFDATWYYGDLVFIVDPWLWLILGGATALAGARTRAGSFTLAAAAALGSVVIFGSGQAPAWFEALWLLALGLLALARAGALGRARPGAVLAVSAALSLLYLGGLGVFRALAVERVRDAQAGAGAAEITPMPTPIDPRRWDVLVVDGERIVQRTVEVGGALGEAHAYERRLADPQVALALASPCTAWWRSFARHGYAESLATNQGTFVQLYDARYRASWCAAEVLVRGDGEVVPVEQLPGSPSAAPLRSER